MQLEADKIYQGTSQINLGTGPGRPWCRYATAGHTWGSHKKYLRPAITGCVKELHWFEDLLYMQEKVG